MKVLLFVASALLSAISAHKVVHLNAQNFDTVVDGSRNVLVKFEASWCGPCKRIAPILDIVVREAFSNLNGDTVIAAIDADEEREIGDRFEIDAFPTIKLFLKGRPQEEAIDFTGERTPQGFVSFIKENIAANLATLPEDVRLAPPNVPMTNILAEMARVGPKPLAPANLNFATAFFEEKTFLPEKPQPKQKNLKHRKDRNRSNKQQVAQKPHKPQNVVGPEYLPIVSADQAQQIISNAGSRPVILIFFSPSTLQESNFYLFSSSHHFYFLICF